MRRVDNLLTMERCAGCERELAASWKFCVYCGRPLVAATSTHIREAYSEASDAHGGPHRRKHGGAFWLGIGIGVFGLAVLIYAATQIYGSAA
jgi:hypothetical protein